MLTGLIKRDYFAANKKLGVWENKIQLYTINNIVKAQ